MACRVIAFYTAMAQGRKYVSYSRQQAMQKEGEGKEESEEGSKRKEVERRRESSNLFSPVKGPFNATSQSRVPRNPINNSFNALNQSGIPRNPINNSFNALNQSQPPRNPINNSFNALNQSQPPRNPMNNSFSPINQSQPPREPRPNITPLNTRFQTPFSAQQRSPLVSKPVNSGSSSISQGTALQTIPRPSLENPTLRQYKPTPILHNQYRNTEHTRSNSSSAFQTSPSSSNPISLFTSSSAKNTTKGNSLLGLAAGLQQQYFKTS